ncbi:hypothetical protein ACLSY3_09875 [Avibacterium avium]|uniref:hypothetical protein n=1 Tax=Avibacterium avium TaxID=751 RepID=UPI003BF790BE
MEKLSKLINNNVNLNDIDFVFLQNSKSWVGYINFIGGDSLRGIDLTMDLFCKFFEKDSISFFSLNTLAYDEKDNFSDLGEYSDLYFDALKKNLIHNNWDEVIKISYENLLHSGLCRLDFNWDNIISISKLTMAIDLFSDISLLIGNFLIINPSLNIALSPRGIGFDIFCLNEDLETYFNFIEFFSKFNNFKCFVSMRYLLTLNNGGIRKIFSIYKHGDYENTAKQKKHFFKTNKIVNLKNINFSSFSKSKNWVGSFEAKNKRDNMLVKESISLFNNFFKFEVNHFFLLSSLMYYDNGAISEELINYIDIYKNAKENNLLRPFVEKFSSKKNININLLNLCFDYNTSISFCELIMELSFNNIIGQTCFLINPELQIALYPHDDIGFGVIALDSDPTLGIEFLKFCEKDSRFRVNIAPEILSKISGA